MRCLAVCHSELVIRLLAAALPADYDLDVLVESPPLARRLEHDGISTTVGDPKRVDTFVRADVTPSTIVILEDHPRRGLKKVLQSLRASGSTLIYVLGTSPAELARVESLRQEFPEVTTLSLAELAGPPLTTALGRSVTRQKVNQYQRYFADADRVLILTHHDPDPDAIASGVALRTLLRRTRQTAIVGTLHPVSRPENQRMLALLDIHVDTITPSDLGKFDKIAMVDVQPHYFGDLLPQVDLVIDHHPERSGYNAVFRDIRPQYGSTSTILSEHLRAVDFDISERTATAMLYAIKSDTLFFNRQANRADLEAFSYLYPLADATLIRKMEGAEITLERLDYVIKAWQQGRMMEHVFCAFLGEPPREDFIPYVADFYLQLEHTQWTVISGVVNDAFVVSVRNVGYSRNAGDFVRRWFSDIGSAGGHRTMAKAVVPLEAFQQKFGTSEGSRVNQRMLELVLDFLHEQARGGARGTSASGAGGRDGGTAPKLADRKPASDRAEPKAAVPGPADEGAG
jgi:nanoRNase/pAp phosphatase (c-di-AMP/oligoRNAs hydrolase)